MLERWRKSGKMEKKMEIWRLVVNVLENNVKIWNYLENMKIM
jgi:hypothetical protein